MIFQFRVRHSNGVLDINIATVYPQAISKHPQAHHFIVVCRTWRWKLVHKKFQLMWTYENLKIGQKFHRSHYKPVWNLQLVFPEQMSNSVLNTFSQKVSFLFIHKANTRLHSCHWENVPGWPEDHRQPFPLRIQK